MPSPPRPTWQVSLTPTRRQPGQSVSGVNSGGEGRERGQRSGETPGPWAGTPPHSPLTPCLPAPLPPRRAALAPPVHPPESPDSAGCPVTFHVEAVSASGGAGRRARPWGRVRGGLLLLLQLGRIHSSHPPFRPSASPGVDSQARYRLSRETKPRVALVGPDTAAVTAQQLNPLFPTFSLKV